MKKFFLFLALTLIGVTAHTAQAQEPKWLNISQGDLTIDINPESIVRSPGGAATSAQFRFTNDQGVRIHYATVVKSQCEAGRGKILLRDANREIEGLQAYDMQVKTHAENIAYVLCGVK
jgi:hypothetical protein